MRFMVQYFISRIYSANSFYILEDEGHIFLIMYSNTATLSIKNCVCISYMLKLQMNIIEHSIVKIEDEVVTYE